MIHVVIPVHNRLKFTKSCIKSIINQKKCEKINIIIVDDGSKDGTSTYIKKKFPKITILNGSGSLYWGGAINLGVEYVKKNSNKNDWLLVVNNDVELSSNAISELIKSSKGYKKKALIGALTLNLRDKRTIIKSGTIVKSWFLNKTKHIYQGLNINNLKNKKPIKVDFLTGRCLLHPMKVFSKIGNYDSKTFLHYGGDDEISMRVKKYGYVTAICPNSIVYLNSNNHKKLNRNVLMRFLYVLFSIKSSSNLINKFNFTLKVVPAQAKLSFFFIGIIKSIYIFFKK
jgi:GT2 family glycosyltransferase